VTTIIKHLLLPADTTGDVTASHAYVAEAESDVECVSDGRGGVVAVRCSALEAQSAACQVTLLYTHLLLPLVCTYCCICI
jgi:hypothetical protein